MQPNGTSPMDPSRKTEQAGHQHAEDNLWQALGTLWNWRRFIAGVTGAVAVAAIVISLLLPNWYAASVRVLPPEGGGGGPLAAALLKSTSSAASAFLGGVSSDYARYLAILSSRTVYGRVVDEFDLVSVYELQDERSPRASAIETLEGKVELHIDEEFEYLAVVVTDKDPQRAADMANFMVEELNRVHNDLSARNAANYRLFVEQRYNEANAKVDSILDATQAFQEQYGIFNLDVQTKAFFDQLASLKGNVALAEIEFEALREQLGPDNAQVETRRQFAEAAQRKVADILDGGEALLPISQQQMPDVARAYVELKREGLVQETVLEVIAPMLEQARFDEEKRVEAVQVVDPAVPPARKSSPRRSVIVVVATFTGLLLASMFALLYAWWHRRHAYFADRLRTSAERETHTAKVQG